MIVQQVSLLICIIYVRIVSNKGKENRRQHVLPASAARPVCEMMELEVRQLVHKSVSGPVPEYTSDRVLSCEASEPQCCQVEGH